jgi:hypothetical protein
MESYEQAVDLALMVVDLDKSVYKTMIRTGLKQYLNSQYALLLKSQDNKSIGKFMLASKILLNDMQSIPVNSCGGRTSTTCASCSSCMVNKCDSDVNYKTGVYQEALIDPFNVVNSNVTRYIDGFNGETWNPEFSRMAQPLDTIGLYQSNNPESIRNYKRNSGYGPEAKVKLQEHNTVPTTHMTHDNRMRPNSWNMSQVNKSFIKAVGEVSLSSDKPKVYSHTANFNYVNDNGEGYLQGQTVEQVDNQAPKIENIYKKISFNKAE